MAISIFTELKQWDNARMWARKAQDKSKRGSITGSISEKDDTWNNYTDELLTRQADWVNETGDYREAGRLYLQAKK